MESPKEVKLIFKALHISAGIIGIAIIAGGIALAYKNYLDMQLTKLNILKVSKDLKIKDADHQKDLWNDYKEGIDEETPPAVASNTNTLT